MDIVAASGTGTVQALHAQEGRFRTVDDALAEEAALQILVDGAAFSMTMRTPGQDTDLAIGLLHGEGELVSWDDVETAKEIPAAGEGCSDAIEIMRKPAAREDRKPAERRLISNASCGVCGKVSAEDLEVQALRGDRAEARLDLALIPVLEGRMRSAQELFSRTGGSHAAALFAADGGLLVLREDVGRHNAVDKAIGHLLRERALKQAGLLFISGRVSYEIVSKAAKANIPFLLAVSAPSTLAVKLCREAGITLLAFCRGGKATVYSHPERVFWEDRGHAHAPAMDLTASITRGEA
ncbi:MAG: formate dehydrogenase accessory sulfurtransferase FdhD [Fibrobacteres bacterium]|nr:formate dehydrogenase accessory sulfurtransferase FdhD [Fibrobacterota bacterium]